MDKCIDQKYTNKFELLALHMLLKESRYGYDIIKLIEERSNGIFVLKESTLYAILKRLEKESYIQSYWGDETSGGRRKYYEITLAGQQYYDKLLQNWQRMKILFDKLLE